MFKTLVVLYLLGINTIRLLSGDLFLFDIIVTLFFSHFFYHARNYFDQLSKKFIVIPIASLRQNRLNLIHSLNLLIVEFFVLSLCFLLQKNEQKNIYYNYYSCLLANRFKYYHTIYSLGDWPTYLESATVFSSSFGSLIGIYNTNKCLDKYGDQDLEISPAYKIIRCVISLLFIVIYKVFVIDTYEYKIYEKYT